MLNHFVSFIHKFPRVRRFPHKASFVMLIGVSAVTLTLWQALRIQQQEALRLRVQQKTANISYAIEQEIEGSILALERMGNRWEQSGKPDRGIWEADAALYVKHYGTFQAIAWADSSFRIQWVVSSLGNEATQGSNVMSEFRRRQAISRAISHRRPAIAHTVPLMQGGRGFLVYVPIFRQNQFEGLIIGVCRTQALLDKVVKGMEMQGTGGDGVNLYDGSDLIYTYRPSPNSAYQQWGKPGSVSVREMEWQLNIAPGQEIINKTYSPIAEIVLGVGLILAILLATIVELSLITYQQSHNYAVEIGRALVAEKRLNDLKSQFITAASHEFRTPLAIIASSTGILEEYYDKLAMKQRQKHLQRIQSSVEHMVNILEDVLMIEQIDKGKMECNPTEINLEEFCNVLIKKAEPDVPHSRIEILSSLSEVSAKNSITLDGQLVWQVLNNLLSNALKYSPPGSPIFLNIHCQYQKLVFEVRDQGIGIPKEDLEEIFTPFHRGSNVGTIPGTGLGLTLVKRCVNLHAGTITVNSEPGSGTCVIVHIPIH